MLPPVPCDQTQDDAPRLVPLFVYGTLMRGRSDHQRVSHLLAAEPRSGSVSGTLHTSPHGHWPLLVPHPTGIVGGELLPIRRTSELWQTLGDYEVAWGYELRWLPFTPDDNREPAGVLTCVWPWLDQVGAPIPTGYWSSRT